MTNVNHEKRAGTHTQYYDDKDVAISCRLGSIHPGLRYGSTRDLLFGMKSWHMRLWNWNNHMCLCGLPSAAQSKVLGALDELI